MPRDVSPARVYVAVGFPLKPKGGSFSASWEAPSCVESRRVESTTYCNLALPSTMQQTRMISSGIPAAMEYDWSLTLFRALSKHQIPEIAIQHQEHAW